MLSMVHVKSSSCSIGPCTHAAVDYVMLHTQVFTSAVFVCTQMVTLVSRRCFQRVVAFISLDSRIN